MSALNARQSTGQLPSCYLFLFEMGRTVGMQEKGMLHLALENVEIYLWKKGFVDCKCSNLNASGTYTLYHPLLGYNREYPFPTSTGKGALQNTPQ